MIIFHRLISADFFYKKSAKNSIGSVGFYLIIWIKPSVICGTTLSAKYYLNGYDLVSNISFSWFLIISYFVFSSISLFSFSTY